MIAAAVQMRLIPDRRHGHRHVSVVGQQRSAAGRARAADHPLVAGAGVETDHAGRRRRGWHGRRRAAAQQALHQLQRLQHRRAAPAVGRRLRAGGQAGAADDGGIVGRVGWLQVGGQLSAQLDGQPGTQDLAGPVAAENQGHEFRPVKAVHRPPGLRRKAQQGELQRPLTGALAHPGIDAGRVGFQRAAGLSGQTGQLIFGRAVQSQGAREAIHRQRHLAQHLAQAARAHAPLQLHLPQPVLGVDVALSKEKVILVLGVDMRHSPAVADDLHRTVQTDNACATHGLRQETTQEGQAGGRGGGQQRGEREQQEQ
jgi:hypothetical protein